MGFFLMPGGGIGKNFIILGADVRYSILILGECPTQGLDGMTLITEKKKIQSILQSIIKTFI